jgi:hypothetical protein
MDDVFALFEHASKPIIYVTNLLIRELEKFSIK